MLALLRQSAVRYLVPPLFAGQRLLRHLQPSGAAAFRILLFHDVSGPAMGAFRTLVATLAAEQRLLPPGVASSGSETSFRDAGGHGAVLSFDDGFLSNFAAGEMLREEFGVSAVFFLCPGLMELSGNAQKEAIARRIFRGRVGAGAVGDDRRLMTWDDAARLMGMGHVIGSHALSHQCLAELPQEAQVEEIAGAAELFRRRLGRVPEWFAYPFGDAESIDPPALRTIRKIHRLCRSGVRGQNTAMQDQFLLFAEHVDLDRPLMYQRFAAEGGLDFFYRGARQKILEDWRQAQLNET